MKAASRFLIVFVVASLVFGLSVLLSFNVSQAEIMTRFDALWAFVQITLIMAGILASPVVMASTMAKLLSVMRGGYQPKHKTKRAA